MTEPIKWRPYLYQLMNRSIFVSDFPKLFSAMEETGICPILEDDGLKWYCGHYKISKAEVRRVWYLSKNQLERIENHIIVEGWPYWES